MSKYAGPSLLEMMESEFDRLRVHLRSNPDSYLEGRIDGLATSIGIVRHPYGWLKMRPGWESDIQSVYDASDARIATGLPGPVWNGEKD